MGNNIFEDFKHTAYRVETLPVYSVQDEIEDYNRFLLGQPLNPNNNDEWLKTIHKATQAGKIFERIRIISNELTDYEKYEFLCYHNNSIAGEKIYVLSADDYNKLVADEMKGDFWIFDNELLVKLNYNSNGEFLNIQQIDNNLIVQDYKNIFEDLKLKVRFDYTEVVRQINLSKIQISI